MRNEKELIINVLHTKPLCYVEQVTTELRKNIMKVLCELFTLYTCMLK